MTLQDVKSGEQFAVIPGCVIDKIQFKTKDGEMEAAFFISHKDSKQQPALVSAISTGVVLQLESDTETNPEGTDAKQEETGF